MLLAAAAIRSISRCSRFWLMPVRVPKSAHLQLVLKVGDRQPHLAIPYGKGHIAIAIGNALIQLLTGYLAFFRYELGLLLCRVRGRPILRQLSAPTGSLPSKRIRAKVFDFAM